MQYTTLGRTGIRVSRLGLGCMRLPVRDDGKVDRPEAAALIRRALEGGITILDSHPNYHAGESEEVIGEALDGVPRDAYVLQTKTPIYKAPTEDDNFETRLDMSLRRLRTDHIDVYLYHSAALEHVKANGEAALEVMRRAREDGRIRHLGLSTHDTPDNVRTLVDSGVFESILMQYNLLDRKYAPCFEHARAKGMGTSVMGPIGGGRLVHPSDLTTLVPGSSSAAEACLRFVWSDPNVDVAFSGMSTLEQLEENLAIAARAKPLEPDELDALEAEVEKRKALADLYCTGCNYCMPCPNGVNIPNCFLYMNWLAVYGLEGPARRAYAGLVEKEADASRCVACGECEDKCPQRIHIAEQLERTHQALAEKQGD